MKVLDLRCANGHGFEGWFGSEEEFVDQNERQAIECPLCADRAMTRLPSSPRLNLSGAREPVPAAAPTTAVSAPADLQVQWMKAMRHLIESTEDVGERFTEEARRIHYEESPARGIRGQASAEQRLALREEGIEVMALALPRLLDGPLQ